MFRAIDFKGQNILLFEFCFGHISAQKHLGFLFANVSLHCYCLTAESSFRVRNALELGIAAKWLSWVYCLETSMLTENVLRTRAWKGRGYKILPRCSQWNSHKVWDPPMTSACYWEQLKGASHHTGSEFRKLKIAIYNLGRSSI